MKRFVLCFCILCSFVVASSRAQATGIYVSAFVNDSAISLEQTIITGGTQYTGLLGLFSLGFTVAITNTGPAAVWTVTDIVVDNESAIPANMKLLLNGSDFASPLAGQLVNISLTGEGNVVPKPTSPGDDFSIVTSLSLGAFFNPDEAILSGRDSGRVFGVDPSPWLFSSVSGDFPLPFNPLFSKQILATLPPNTQLLSPNSITVTVSPVPEPTTLVLFAVGFVALLGLSYRRQKKAA